MFLPFHVCPPAVPEFFEGPNFFAAKKGSGDKKSEECPRTKAGTLPMNCSFFVLDELTS